MFERIWRHSRFLKLHPMDRTCPPIRLFKRDDGSSSGRSFFAAMCDVPIDDMAHCHVRRLTMYKKRGNFEHEFVVAELTNAAYLLVERLMPESTPSNKIASTSPGSSSSITKSIPADDRASIYPTKDATFTNAVSTVDLVHNYTFTRFPVLEFSRIIAAISDYSGNYMFKYTMCYWYASMITALATQLFQCANSEECNSYLAACSIVLTMHDEIVGGFCVCSQFLNNLSS